jgi:hypothetical protein
VDGHKIVSRMGTIIAKKIRDRVKAGRGAEGDLPQRKDGSNPPLRATGALVQSIKFKRYRKGLPGGYVHPMDVRSRPKGGTVANALILRSQIKERPDLAATDPMGVTAEIEAAAAEVAEKEIARQLSGSASESFGLFTGGFFREIKTIR